ncbi:hypothetical protein STCU_10776 [Strigomonas culicis]|uniref:Uncharacterized protein n=1 Tax=Strigomonas culicis TaxID=28005 RepID=S9URI4_9TRYP|nr:hypothetical protein STCU_10776 [Strigomonas culicis]|eukprot:EPY17196.1 hypothetical protein STCU_10776 [Strigomonas culicis]
MKDGSDVDDMYTERDSVSGEGTASVSVAVRVASGMASRIRGMLVSSLGAVAARPPAAAGGSPPLSCRGVAPDTL